MSWKSTDNLFKKRLDGHHFNNFQGFVFERSGFYFEALHLTFLAISLFVLSLFLSFALSNCGNTTLFSTLIAEIVNKYMHLSSWKSTDLGAENQQQIIPTLRNGHYAIFRCFLHWLGILTQTLIWLGHLIMGKLNMWNTIITALML